jgi:NAD(P)-dependent dehydrogenase (short-subunit alcohol dehydrogenase family)
VLLLEQLDPPREMAEVTSSNKRIILVAGATGQQGGALIRSLLSSDVADQAIDYHIFALTRNSSSAAARALSATYSKQVAVVQGDLDDPASIRKIFENAKAEGRAGIWGVYSVTAFPGLGASTEPEERQGKVRISIIHVL